jgi:methionyl aminopeptidase
MTLAIEVIYTAGSGKMRTLDDDWTVVTADGRLAGLFEHSIAITATGPIILTLLR